MKKIFLLLTMFLIFTISPKAKEMEYNDVAAAYVEKYDWDKIKGTQEYQIYKDFEDNVNFSFEENELIVSFVSESKEYKTIFTYNNNIISFSNKDQFNETNLDYITKSLIDNLSIAKMIYVVGELKGYTVEDLLNNASAIESNQLTLFKNGLEINWSTQTINNIEVSYIEEFNIDLKNFNLEGKDEIIKNEEESEEEQKPIVKKETNQKIPSNMLIAFFTLGMLIILIIILSIYLLKSSQN